jgi:cytochrome c-type biogenesis protein CcmH
MMINKALAIEPNNPKANYMAGLAAMERGDYADAISHWEILLKLVNPNSKDPEEAKEAQEIAELLKESRDALARGDKPMPPPPGMEGDTVGGGAPMMDGAPMMGGGEQAPAASSGKERITGTVTLSPALKSKVRPDDLLYISAVAESGPPMPLAAIRLQASDLPAKFSLDDSNAVAPMPQMRLSKFDRVIVKARITQSGQPIAQPGDLQGISVTLKPGTNGVNLVIDTEVK